MKKCSYALSLSTVVLNSRDQHKKHGTTHFMCLDNMPHNIQLSLCSSLQLQLCSRTGLETSLRKLTNFCQVHDLCTRSKMLTKIFTTRQEYSSIETHAIIVLSSVLTCSKYLRVNV